MTFNVADPLTLRRTKIVCTIGPGSTSEPVVRGLLEAGMDVARLNFSHGTHREHARRIRLLRQEAKKLGKPLAILQDVPGPKERTGRVRKGSAFLTEGSRFVLTTRTVLGDETQVSVDWPELPASLKKGTAVFLDDGALKLVVEDILGTDAVCRVITGGNLGDHRGINVPGITRDVSTMTEKDWHHLKFGIEYKVDFVALSFIGKADDIIKVRDFLRQRNSNKMLIAKIERHEALDNLDEILAAADGIMVARGDLGIEIPIEKVPITQKQIIEKCNHAGKPVIVATQMLESMVESPRPTRAEVTDVANAIYDGADAVMLSEETAIGRYPVEAVQTMSRVALETEKVLPYNEILARKEKDQQHITDDAISYSACHIARQLGAAAIIAFTSSGSTARRVARYRPQVPVLAITPDQSTIRELALSWGVYCSKVPSAKKVLELFTMGREAVKKAGLARSGDLVVITGGVPIGVPGTTNLLKVERIE